MTAEPLLVEAATQIGTFAGAVSGVRLASVKRLDWFGAYVVGLVTALGGGTLRDILLMQRPFWLSDPSYLATSFLAVVAVSVFGRRFISEQITWFFFDTVAISFFMLAGMEKTIDVERAAALAQGLAYGRDAAVACWWRAIAMGVVTAVFGGVLRDICINEVPLIFRKELYAVACAAGGGLYFALSALGADRRVAGVVCVVSIFAIRALAIKFRLGVPVLTGHGSRLLHPHHAHRRRGRAQDPRAEAPLHRG